MQPWEPFELILLAAILVIVFGAVMVLISKLINMPTDRGRRRK
jgi:hypothetical protein